MINVCVVVHNHPSALMGGAQYQADLLARELARRPGVGVTYLTRGMRSDRCTRDQYPYSVWRIGSAAGIRRRAAFFDTFGLRDALRQLRPDLIYQQMRESYTAVCAQYARRNSVPFFFHVASDLDLDTGWMPRRVSGNLPFDMVEAITGIWGLRHAEHVIVQTERQRRVLRDRFRREASVVVRNFQPLPASLPHKPAGPLRVFWVANFKGVKRPELFVDLAESFSGRSDIRFLMAGRPSDLRRYDALMRRIKIVPNLQYLGELPVEEVNRVMAEAHVHVNTSSVEGFPNTFIQAWAQGAVVVTIAIDPDEHSMESAGIGFCTGTLQQLRDVIDRLARSPHERQAIAERSFAFAHSQHSMTHGERLADLMLDKAAAALAARASSNRRSGG